jgi:hypothetical protein
MRLSAGHSPACAVNAKPAVATKAAATVWSKILLLEVYIPISLSVSPRPPYEAPQ